MAGIAQLVRASVCGTEGRGFKPLFSPHYINLSWGQGVKENYTICS